MRILTRTVHAIVAVVVASVFVACSSPVDRLHRAIDAGDLDRVRGIVAGDPSVLAWEQETVSENDLVALAESVLGNVLDRADIRMQARVVARGLSATNETTFFAEALSRRSAIGYAILRGADREIVHFLARVSPVEGGMWAVYGAFITALRHERYDAVDAILESGFDINYDNDLGPTLWHLSSEPFGAERIHYLVRNGFALSEDRYFTQAFHRAVAVGNGAVVRILIEAGVDVDGHDTVGATALYRATWNNDIEMMRILLDADADPDYGGLREVYPVHYVRSQRALDTLLSYDADLNLVSSDGLNGVHRIVATIRSTALSGREYSDPFSALRYAVETGANVNARADRGYTPLGWALDHDVPSEVIAFLQDNGAER